MSGAPRVLIVEDEAFVAMELRARLEDLGYEVDGVLAHGEAALAIEPSELPDLVLMDVNLVGEMDGIETARRLREAGDLAVVFLTAYSDAGLVRRAMEVDAHGFLTKPFREKELEVTLRLALKRRELETALAQANQGLEQRVRERTESLRQARNEAERANAAKSDFLSRASHELRTPLNVILGFAQLLELPGDLHLSEAHRDHVREIHRAGQHLLRMVDDILGLARLDTGKLDVRSAPLSLLPVVQECAAEIGPAAARRDVTVILPQGGPSSVFADAAHFKQVLLNLLSNAVKFNREGGVIRIECTSMADRRVRISVTDSGRGLSSEEQVRLFRPFERLESAYEGVEGMGIGLFQAKKLVEGMGGTIGVESEPGVGSTFWFELPETTGTDGRTVLLIGGNPAKQRLMERILASRGGLEFLHAESVEAGMKLVVTGRPDLILVHLDLPDSYGSGGSRHLRRSEGTRDIPVIAITAEATTRTKRQARDAGFRDVLAEPLAPRAVLDVINRHLTPYPSPDGE